MEPTRPDRTTGTGLEFCTVCGRDFVAPLEWEPLGEDRWWMLLRCAECGLSREATVDNDEAERFEAALHRRSALIARAARASLERERMAAEVEVFADAIRRGLIEAGDFAF